MAFSPTLPELWRQLRGSQEGRARRMGSDTNKPGEGYPRKTAPLSDALDQSEQVQTKVERAGVALSSVNAVLKTEVAGRAPIANVEGALNQSEAIEVKVQEAAAELVAVNEALAQEIDERHHLEDELAESNAALEKSRISERASRDSALHDPITGLPNLTLFNDRLRTALAQAHRHAWRLAVMFVDLDGFKHVNDTHGHDVGDSVLQEVAQRMHNVVRASDTVSRRSGDEFLLLMLEVRDEPSAAAFAAKIAAIIAEPCKIGALRLTVQASIGIAFYPDDGKSAQDLLRNADAAMYEAKQHKNGPAFYGRLPAPQA
jgi:diguanylate cyclase (GGDEF)-like protein